MEDSIETGLLARFGNDLWIERRLKLDQMMEYIQAECSTRQDTLQSDWIRFVKFLEAECCGAYFDTDKQWSLLLNLMEISKKLNHRRFRVRDIIFSKIKIESNASQIRLLNRSAKIARTVETLLGDLKSLTKLCQLKLPVRKNDETSCQESGFSIGEISASRHYLLDRCLPLIHTLKLELINDELRAGGADFEVLQSDLAKQDEFVVKLDRFLSSMHSFQFKLLQLKPLMNTYTSPGNRTGGGIFNNAFAECKTKFHSILEFHTKLSNLLHSLAFSGFSAIKRVDLVREEPNCIVLPLVKLFNPRNELIQADLFDQGLIEAIEELSEIQRSMDEIMRSLRCEFGRFYFVNDLELLTIISLDTRLICETSPYNQHLIGKLFNNSINKLIVSQTDGQVVAIQSPFNEVIELKGEHRVPLKKKINVYSVEIVRIFNEIIRKLRKVLASMLIESLTQKQPEDSIDWSLPVQLMNLAEYIKFSRRVEQNLEIGDSFDKLVEFYKIRFAHLSKEISNSVGTVGTMEFKHSAALSLTVHFISTLIMLERYKVRDKSDWRWVKQVRYYLVEETHITEVHIADAVFVYKFDYLPMQVANSNAGEQNQVTFKRLINTQMSERCFLAASQAVHFFRLGANPFGPAGSGKTETIKALGHLLGCQVIVHNCDETNDSESIDRLIWGLAHTGLWGCFDEFNRLSSATLSSVSGTLELVQTCIREGKTNVELDSSGNLMCVDPNSAFFITLNPGDSNKYRGRRRLPTNLRNLFLPVSMTRVEIEPIFAESLLDLCTRLIEDGRQLNGLIDESIRLSRKLAAWLDFMKASLCSNRCEWDLRLVMAILKRMNMFPNHNASDTLESRLIISILAEVSPRLSSQERISLADSLREYFDYHLDSSDQTLDLKKLVDSLKSVYTSNKDQDFETVTQQVVDLHHQLQTRTGVMLLGPTNSGKSRTWKLLHKASRCTKWVGVNPRSCTKRTLFGQVDPVTRKWSDGLFTKQVREAQNMLRDDAKLTQVWIILDGPVDPDWIEFLNSVLDDNQVLTLSSGERLNFCLSSNQSIKLIFETNDISFASPATISRLGLVYLTDSGIDRVDLDTFSAEDGRELLIVTCKDPSTRLNYIRNRLQQALVVEYTCNRNSSCQHLEELISKHYVLSSEQTDLYIVLDNVDSIMLDEAWHFNSFIELMRFILTYGYYYESTSLDSIKIETKFVLSMESAENLNERILSLGCLIKLDSAAAEAKSASGNRELSVEEEMRKFVESSKLKTEARIYMVSSISSEYETKLQITSNYQGWRVYQFNNLLAAEESIVELESALKTTSSHQNGGQKLLYILTSSECLLIAADMKSRLYHCVNLLKLSDRFLIKFFILSHRVLFDKSDLNFWRLISDEQLDLPIGPPIGVYDRLVALNNQKRCKLTENQVQWLAEKLNSSQREVDELQIGAHLTALCGLIESTSTELQVRRGRLLIGSKLLGEFEQSVERMRIDCMQEHEQLQVKKSEIEQLIRDLNSDMENSRLQRSQSGKLKRDQEAKAKEIQTKSELVENELNSAQESVEASKTEIHLHLKPEALNEIKTLRSPPELVRDVLDVLMIFLVGSTETDRSWTSVKSYLTKYSLRDELTRYDFRRRLNANLLSKISKQMKLKPASFDAKQANRASQAIVPILGWIKATMEYGKVLVKTQPLSDEMQLLTKELDALNAKNKKLEAVIVSLDDEIERSTSKLSKLKQECDDAQKRLGKVQIQLDRAQKVRSEVGGQFSKWRRDLNSIDSIEQNDLPIKYSLLASSLAILAGDGKDHAAQLGDWIHLFGLPEQTKDVFVREVMETLFGEQVIFKWEEADQLLELIIFKICLQFQHFVVPFVDTDDCMREELIRKYLSFKSILCAEKDIIFVRCGDVSSSGWIQSVEMATRLNKIVLINIGDNETLDLDVMDLISRQASSRIILIGQLERHPSIGHLLRPIRWSKRQSSNEQTSFAIMNHIIARCNPELGKSWDNLEKELREKRKALKQLESSLLSRLTSGGSDHSNKQQVATSCLREDVVEILNDVHESSKQLSGDMNALELKLSSLLDKQRQFFGFASEAAQFYNKFLADLSEQDKFYEMPLRRYMELLLPFFEIADKTGAISSNCSPTKTSGTGITVKQKPAIDYERVVEFAELPMQAKDRIHFRERVKNQQVVGSCNSSGCSSDNSDPMKDSVDVSSFNCCANIPKKTLLKKTILDLLATLEENSDFRLGESGGCLTKLMIILHDSSKSSPQFELDELFNEELQAQSTAAAAAAATIKTTTSCCYQYSKVYATGNQQRNLKEAIERVILRTRDGCGNLSQQERRVVRCLCIANAHLAATFINEHLLEMLGEGSCGENQTMITKTLLLLVAESTPSISGSLCKFDSLVLDFAQVKLWHDELGLELSDRFELLERSCLSQLSITKVAPAVATRKANKAIATSEQLNLLPVRQLGRQVILFHVVCQELVRRGKPTTAPMVANTDDESSELGFPIWRANYSFDYDQIRLALKTVFRCLSSGELSNGTRAISDSSRVNVCCHLETSIYGARMETLEDEKLLSGLMQLFLGSTEIGDRQVAKLERYLRNVAGSTEGKPPALARSSQEGKLLAELLVGHL